MKSCAVLGGGASAGGRKELEERLGGTGGRIAERRHAPVAADEASGAVAGQLHLGLAGAEHGAKRPAKDVKACAAAAEHHGPRVEGAQGVAEAGVGQRSREHEDAQPGAAKEELKGLYVDPLRPERGT